ncbi:MAG: hypothetical protein IID54_02490 [Proteobacteria bacterium]|nr:hypothetical protein [Pseudomonadota bacterium]
MMERCLSRHRAKRLTPAALLALAAVMLAACQTGPTYRPRGTGELVGYADRQLTEIRYRVTFFGSTRTRREDVEDYLLQRAAEVTIDAGYTHFIFDARDTQAHTYYRTIFSSRVGFGYGPRFFYRMGFASHGHGYGYGFGYGGDAIAVTRYQAYSEIVMLTDEEAARTPESLDARDVLYRLSQG